MKIDLVFIYSITRMSTAPVTECLNKHDMFFLTVLICNKAQNPFISVKDFQFQLF